MTKKPIVSSVVFFFAYSRTTLINNNTDPASPGCSESDEIVGCIWDRLMRSNRSGHYWVCQIQDVKLLPTIAQKVQDDPLTPNTAQLLWLELSRHQIADKLQFIYLVVTCSNRVQNKIQKFAVNLEKCQHTNLNNRY